ncbi:antitoxin family protein [Armatimonas sp.]|uniref:antitoxin family protein n=1 Tax=Armatimonas sp. TaxID=1872638 RepID=UPI00286AE4A4|nr:antitoxin family protein [Armatimonas sp.]
MSVVTYEAIVENGKLRLLEPVSLPEQTRVYVVVPQPKLPELPETKKIRTPHLKNPADVADFVMEVS